MTFYNMILNILFAAGIKYALSQYKTVMVRSCSMRTHDAAVITVMVNISPFKLFSTALCKYVFFPQLLLAM